MTSRSGAPAVSTLVVGGGCFWCVEAVFAELKGVRSVEPGYAGGSVPDPTYEEVCEGSTGHAEVVRITFDPSAISLADLLRIFFTVHDPTTRDRQGADVGRQYRSIILTDGPEQAATAEDVVREVGAAHLWKHPIVTERVPLAAFYPAEEYHRDYYRRNPNQSYCRLVIEPKVLKFRHAYADRLRSSPAPAPRAGQ